MESRLLSSMLKMNMVVCVGEENDSTTYSKIMTISVEDSAPCVYLLYVDGGTYYNSLSLRGINHTADVCLPAELDAHLANRGEYVLNGSQVRFS